MNPDHHPGPNTRAKKRSLVPPLNFSRPKLFRDNTKAARKRSQSEPNLPTPTKPFQTTHRPIREEWITHQTASRPSRVAARPTNLRRQKPLDKSSKPTRRSTSEHGLPSRTTTALKELLLECTPRGSTPIHFTSNPPSPSFTTSRAPTPIPTTEHPLQPTTPTSPSQPKHFSFNQEEIVETEAEAELEWDNFSQDLSFQEFRGILEEALDQLYLQESLIEQYPITEEGLHDQLPGDLNTTSETYNVSTDILVPLKSFIMPDAQEMLLECDNCQTLDTDVETIMDSLDNRTASSLNEKVSKLDTAAEKLGQILNYFRRFPNAAFTDNDKLEAIALKSRLIAKSEAIQAHLRSTERQQPKPDPPTVELINSHENSQSASSRHLIPPVPTQRTDMSVDTDKTLPTPAPRSSTTAAIVKTARVTQKLKPTINELDDLAMAFTEILGVTCSSVASFHRLNAKFTDSMAKANRSINKASKLVDDACAVDLEHEAKAIDEQITYLDTQISDAEKHLDEIKECLGIAPTQYSQSFKNTNLPIPTFSGDHYVDEYDFYTFRKKFTIYIESMPALAAVEQAEILKAKCLKGHARTLCASEKSVTSCMNLLQVHFGSVDAIFARRRCEIMSQGSIHPSRWHTQYEWLLQIRAILTTTQEFAIENGMESALYERADLPNAVLSLLRGNKYQTMVSKFRACTNTSGIQDRKACYQAMLDWITDELCQISFSIAHFENESAIANSHKQMADRNQDGKHDQRKTNAKSNNQQAFGYATSESNTPNVHQQSSRDGSKVNGENGVSRRDKSPTPLLTYTKAATTPTPVQCKPCNTTHLYLYECNNFIQTPIKDRAKVCAKAKICFRCLRSDSQIDFDNIQEWWNNHKNNCRTEYVCIYSECASLTHRRQKHILTCGKHIDINKRRINDFKKSVPKDIQLPQGNLLFMEHRNYHVNNPKPLEDPNSLPEPEGSSIFMCQFTIAPSGQPLFVFFDSGCGTAAISTAAAAELNSVEYRPGPTIMNVAGGQIVKLPYGHDRFQLPLTDSVHSASIIGAKMDEITAPFPQWHLTQAYNELVAHYKGHEELPTVPKTTGGVPVDIILGIQYSKYFPRRLCSLPSGLSLYVSPIKAPDGHQGVLGGPHKAWAKAKETAHFMGANCFFTNELRALRYHSESIINSGRCWVAADSDTETDEDDTKENPNTTTILVSREPKVEILNKKQIQDRSLRAKKIERQWKEFEDLGTTSLYRCINCRGCPACKQSLSLEEVSFVEEREQSLIEQSVSYNASTKTVSALLPFTKEPTNELQDNRVAAEKVLNSQLKKLSKDPVAKQTVLESHHKLVTNGYTKRADELTPEEQGIVDACPGKYYLPWRYVVKASSPTTPCRVVFDASMRTKTGKSLNCILAKGLNKLEKILALHLNFRAGYYAVTFDIKMAYNQIKLKPEHWSYQRYLWHENLDLNSPLTEMFLLTTIYGVKPSGNQTAHGLHLLSQHVKENYPQHKEGAELVDKKLYVDDGSDSFDCKEVRAATVESVRFTLSEGQMAAKAYVLSHEPPPAEVSKDGKSVSFLGYTWYSEEDEIALAPKEIFFGKSVRGKKPKPITGPLIEELKEHFTKRTILSQVSGNFDPIGLYVPCTGKYKYDYHTLIQEENIDWDDRIPDKYLELWAENIQSMALLPLIRFKRSVVTLDAHKDIDLIVSCDASQNMAIVAIHARVVDLAGQVSVRLVAGKSKIVTGSTIPRAELRAAVAAAVFADVATKNLQGKVRRRIFVSDSSIVLSWLNSDTRPLALGVRSAVIEIRRFTQKSEWFHVDTENNIADLGTRMLATQQDIGPDSEWQMGKSWMYKPYCEMPIRPIEEINLTNDQQKQVAREIKVLHADTKSGIEKVTERAAYSKYLYNPCRLPWRKSTRVMSIVTKFCRIDKKQSKSKPVIQPTAIQLSDGELEQGTNYYFRLATKEVKKFSDPKQYKDQAVEKDGILFYKGRIVEGLKVEDINGLLDVKPLHFVRPIIDRYSPIAYSIMLHAHQQLAHHRNVNTTLFESRSIGYILDGRSLAKEVRAACVHCTRYRAKLLQAEMAPVHQNRLTIAPPFYHCQIDLAGPYQAICEHNHRSTVKVWAMVFKDPATGAIAIHALSKMDTDAVVLAILRFSHRFGFPAVLYLDAGTQLIKAAKKSEIKFADITRTLNSRHQISIEHEIGPTQAHNWQGSVERSIKDMKALLYASFYGLKLDVLGYESAFSYIANEMNSLPLCLAVSAENSGEIDLITPNRLLFGHNNRRSPTGPIAIPNPGRLLEQQEILYRSWWQVWTYERIQSYIPVPKRFKETTVDLKEGDTVVFLRSPDELVNDHLWRLGQIDELLPSDDGITRKVVIRWRKDWNEPFRTTTRSVRHIAKLFSEDELTLIDQLNEAAHKADHHMVMNYPDQCYISTFPDINLGITLSCCIESS